jgi:hypothetical protein
MLNDPDLFGSWKNCHCFHLCDDSLPFRLESSCALKLTWLAPPVQGSTHLAATKPGRVALVERGQQHLHAHQTNLSHYCQHSLQRTKTHAVNTLFLRTASWLNTTRWS